MKSHEGHRISNIRAKYNPVDCIFSEDLPQRRAQDRKGVNFIYKSGVKKQ